MANPTLLTCAICRVMTLTLHTYDECIKALRAQLTTERDCRLANEKELRRADALIGIAQERVKALETVLRKMELLASDQQENIGLGMPRKGFATEMFNMAHAALSPAGHNAARQHTERRT